MIKGAGRTLKDASEYIFAHERAVDSPATPDLEAPVVPPTSGLMTWMVKYAAASQRMYSQGPDGRTPYERSTGRRHSSATAEFGDSIWWMPLHTSSNKLPPLEARFEEAFYMATNHGSADSLVLTPTGLVKCRIVRGKPPRERWSRRLLEITGASELQPSTLDSSQRCIGI